MTGLILDYTKFEWPSVFYFFGGLGILWFFAWLFLCYDDPASHPFITVEEKNYLRSTIGHLKRNKVLGCLAVTLPTLYMPINTVYLLCMNCQNLAPVPWGKMALSVPLWGLIIAQIGHDWGLFMIQTDLPKYMKSVLKFSVSQVSNFPSMINSS